MTNLAMCARMSEDRDFTGEVYRVYNQLVGRLEWQNYIMVCQTDIAKALKMRPQNVNRAIKTLVRKGVVIEGKKVERHWTYRLNPNYMWRGEAKSHKDALLEQHNWSVIQGGKKTDAELRAEMEAKGQQRMEFEDGF